MLSSRIRSTVAASALAAVAMACAITPALAHCEVPCGVYGDHARVEGMLEDVTTVEKAMTEMVTLAAKNDAQSQNQMMRWVMNKELHATKIQDTIAQYFLHQRVKPVAAGAEGYEDYITRLVDHHAVMVAAMKTKQSTDLATVSALRETVQKLEAYYPAP
jgi:nickel superoxide dismutase